MSGRQRLPAGEPRKASQRRTRRAAPSQVYVWHPGDKARWRGRICDFQRDLGDEFGPGVYDFSRSPQSGAAAAIALRGLRNLTIRGAGPGATVLRLMPNQNLQLPDTHVIHAFDCRNLTIGDLSVHGAYLMLAHVNEQMHGIQINQGSEEIAATMSARRRFRSSR